MSATTKIWVNGIAPTCEDDDLNGFKSENNNLIVGSGQSLLTTDNQQTHKAVAHYAGVGDFYVDSGVANAYVLSTTGSQVAPPTYATGMRIRFVAGTVNGTGASTVNVAGLGVKNLVQDFGGTPTEVGDMRTDVVTEAYYDGTEFRIVSPVSIDTLGYTPVLSGTSGTPTYSTQQGVAKRMGRTILAHGEIALSSVGTLTGNLSVSLPTTPLVAALGPIIASITKISNTNLSPLPHFGMDYVATPDRVILVKDSLQLQGADLNATFRIEYSLMYFE